MPILMSTMEKTDKEIVVDSDCDELGSSEENASDQSESEDGTCQNEEGSSSGSDSEEEESGDQYTDDDLESFDEDLDSVTEALVTEEETNPSPSPKISIQIEAYSSNSSDYSDESEYTSEDDSEAGKSDCENSKNLTGKDTNNFNQAQNSVENIANVESIRQRGFDDSFQNVSGDLFNENGNLAANKSAGQSFESLGSVLDMPSPDIMSEEEIRQMFCLGNNSSEREEKPFVSKESLPESMHAAVEPTVPALTPKKSFTRLYGGVRRPIHTSTPEDSPIPHPISKSVNVSASKHYSTPVVPRMSFCRAKENSINFEDHQQMSICDTSQAGNALHVLPAKSESAIRKAIPSLTCSTVPGKLPIQSRKIVDASNKIKLDPPVANVKPTDNKENYSVDNVYNSPTLATALSSHLPYGKSIHTSETDETLSHHFTNHKSNNGASDAQTSALSEKRARTREKIIQEILHTEKTYQNHLRLIIQYFEEPLREQQIIPSHIIVTIFSNIRQIISVNEELFQHLTTHQIGEAFLLLGPFLKLYSTYANNHERALATMIEWDQKSPEFATFRRAQEEQEEMKSLKLNALLITPVQRIPRYKLLLEELLQYTDRDHTDYSAMQEAVKQITSVANHINEHIRQQDNFMKILAIQKSLSGQNTPRLLTPGRIFIKEGELKKVSKKGGRSYARKFFLFSDMLMYAKPRLLESGGHHSYVCCCMMPLQHCKVITVFGHGQGQGALFRIECKQESLLLFSDQTTVDSWVSCLKHAIGDFKESRLTLRKASSAKQPVRGAGLARLRRQEKQKDPFTSASRNTPEKAASPGGRTFKELLSSPLSRSLRRPISSPRQRLGKDMSMMSAQGFLSENNSPNHQAEVFATEQREKTAKKTEKRTVEKLDFTSCLLPRKRKKRQPDISMPHYQENPIDLEDEKLQLNQNNIWLDDSAASGGEHSKLSIIQEASFYSPQHTELAEHSPQVKPRPAKGTLSTTVDGSEWSFISNGRAHSTNNADRSTCTNGSATPQKKMNRSSNWEQALDTAATAARLVNESNAYPACSIQ